jgi:dolichol-phosphate mannosyltransferase
MSKTSPKIAAVVPCFRVSSFVTEVVRRAVQFVDVVYVVDDCCPEGSGRVVQSAFSSAKVVVLFNDKNRGVGGAVIAGYKQALADGCDIVVKVDGDGQMAPELIRRFVKPIVDGRADYTKGNRFYNINDLEEMPRLRLFGNAMLSFVSKFSSGYWDVMDPTNGFTAIHRIALSRLPLEKLAERYFFESDMLFRLYLEGAVVCDIPMRASYGEEASNLNIKRVALEFPGKYLKNFSKRIFYSYILRDFNAVSLQGILGVFLSFFGVVFGAFNWLVYSHRSELTPLGTIMIAALCIILGAQFIIAALSLDVSRVPRRPLLDFEDDGINVHG